MVIEGKVLYNLLRLNWLGDPSIKVESWQVEDYRKFSLEVLFERLLALGLSFDERQFHSYADNLGSPEELTTYLLQDSDLEPEQQDQFYLLLFELWRRLLPEKLCLSVFCDELDQQIFLYDKDAVSNAEDIQDIIANLQIILEENTDEGMMPGEAFSLIKGACANDLESFLYDFIADQIDSGNTAYASELLEGFSDYVKESQWFELLKIRLLEESDPDAAEEDLKKFVEKAAKLEDLQLNFELLSVLIQGGDRSEFRRIVKKSIPLLQTEGDFLELLATCVDFYSCLDDDEKEKLGQKILEGRGARDFEDPIDDNDPDLSRLLDVIK